MDSAELQPSVPSLPESTISQSFTCEGQGLVRPSPTPANCWQDWYCVSPVQVTLQFMRAENCTGHVESRE